MSYLDAIVCAVPNANKDAYLAHTREVAPIFKEVGATSYVEAWGDDVPAGKLTDFFMAVKAEKDESVVVGFVTWPDKATRDAGWSQIMQDDRMGKMNPPFDGKRMIWGGFTPIFEA